MSGTQYYVFPFPPYPPVLSGQSVVSVQSFGAVGNGIADDTAAFQAAAAAVAASGGRIFVPAGHYLVSAETLLASNVSVSGVGPSSRMVAAASWPGAGPNKFAFFENVNWAASVLTDHDILVEDMAFDYAGHAYPGGGAHAIRCRMATGVTVSRCTFFGGEDATAMLGCVDTLVEGCSAYNNTNCPYDHWDGANNARVVNCYASTGVAVQMVNFNAIYGVTTTEALTSDGIIVSGNEFVATGTNEAPIFIQPLNTLSSVRNVLVVGNKLTNVPVIGAGNIATVSIQDNIMVGDVSTDCSIRITGDGTNAATSVLITGNQIIAPTVSAGNLAAIRSTGLRNIVANNRVTGGSYPFAGYFDNGATCIGNQFDPGTSGTVNGNVDAGGDLMVPNGHSLGTYDTFGGVLRLTLQGDNNLVFVGTDGGGYPRSIFSIYQHNSLSALDFAVPVLFGAQVGFFNHSPAAQPTLSYSRSSAGETSAVAAIRSALASLGLVLDSTTA